MKALNTLLSLQSFGVNSDSNSHFSGGLASSSFGKGLRKKKPSYQISEEVEDTGSEVGSYEVNYKSTVTHKPGPSFDTGSFKFSSVTSAPKTTKFGSSNKFSSFNHQGAGSSSSSQSSGLFKFNEPSSPSLLSNGQITTKFAINHPAPTHSAANLGGSYQTSFSDEGFGSSSGQLTEKFISDYHTTLAKLKSDKQQQQQQQAQHRGHLKSEQPKFQSSSSPFKTKFSDSSNFKVSSDFKVGAETQFPTKFNSGDLSSFKPNFRLQEVPNLYPSEDQFRPSVGYSGNQLFEPNSDNEDFLQQQLAQNPASKGQYQQYLKAQQDEQIEQQALQEQLKYQHSKPKVPLKSQGLSRPPQSAPPQGFSGSSTKYRPYIQVKKNFNRRKPLVRVASSPGLSHYRTPAIDGPYTIHFSV